MANVNRYRHGPKTIVTVPIASATVLEIGDFVLLSGGNAVPSTVLQPAGAKSSTSKAVAQSAVADVFLGIAMTASAAGETVAVEVDVSLESIYEFAQTTAAAISFGDMIEVDGASTGSNSWGCYDDTVIEGSTNPIAVCVQEHTAAMGVGTLCKLFPQKVLNSVVGHS